MLYRFFLLLIYATFLYGSDGESSGSITDSDEREERIERIVAILNQQAPQEYTLFAAGVTKTHGSFVLYKKQDGLTYLLKNLFEKELKEVPIESMELKMNEPICRCTDCNTIQLKLNLRGQTKFLSLTNQQKPTHGVIADEPAILSIHEPPGVRPEAQVQLLPIEINPFFAMNFKE